MSRWFKRIFKFLLLALLALGATLGVWVFYTQPKLDGDLKLQGLVQRG
jgi:hypothetical protein